MGGDLYDAFMLPGERLCFVVGDVTGKGLPASLFMALAKAVTRSMLNQPNRDLAEAMVGINAELSADNGQDMQLSLLVGILHPDGKLEMCSAGHENPFVVGTDGKIRTLAIDGGPTLCAMDGFPYPLETFRLEAGETLVAFTDGMTEAQDLRHDLFGAKRAARRHRGGGRQADRRSWWTRWWRCAPSRPAARPSDRPQRPWRCSAPRPLTPSG